MGKDKLLEDILAKHRQLERYLFYFEKDRNGIFVATDKPKFSMEEMIQPGVVGDWSLKDLLAHLIDWEQRFIDGYRAGRGGIQEASPLGSSGQDISPMDQGIPDELRGRSLEDVLTMFPSSFQQMLTVAKAIPEEEMFASGVLAWTEEATLAEFLARCTYERYDWAKEKLRRWRRTHAGEYLNKDSVLEKIQTERRRLEKTLSGLSEEQLLETGAVGEWSVKDILAHLVDWEQRFESWYDAGLRDEIPEIPAPGLSWNELDTLNRQIYEKHRNRDLDDIQTEFHKSYEHVLTKIQAMSEEDIFKTGRYAWLGNGNLVGYILANTANHYRWAKTLILKWLKTRNEC
jgi:hypothetical protein